MNWLWFKIKSFWFYVICRNRVDETLNIDKDRLIKSVDVVQMFSKFPLVNSCYALDGIDGKKYLQVATKFTMIGSMRKVLKQARKKCVLWEEIKKT